MPKCSHQVGAVQHSEIGINLELLRIKFPFTILRFPPKDLNPSADDKFQNQLMIDVSSDNAPTRCRN